MQPAWRTPAEAREVLQQAVEERGRDEEVGVLHVGDRFGDGVGDARGSADPLGEPARADGVGPGDAQERVDAGHQAELGRLYPHRPVGHVLHEDRAVAPRPPAAAISCRPWTAEGFGVVELVEARAGS